MTWRAGPNGEFAFQEGFWRAECSGSKIMSISSRFRFILWGAAFAYFSIRIGGVDILPDVVGYALLVIGCSGLDGLSGRFAVARIFWAVLAVLSVVPEWYLGARSTGFGYLVQAIQCGGLWFLLGGMIAFAATAQRADLVQRLTRRRMAFVVLSALFAFYPRLLAKPLDDASGAVVVVTAIAMILTVLMIQHVIWRVKGELAVNVSGVSQSSPALAMLTVLVAGGVGIFFVSQHSGYRSVSFSGANFHAKSPQDCAVVDADLRNVLRDKGFSGSYQPTQMDRFAGIHSSESQDTWLKSDRGEFKGIYLNVSKSPVAISISTKWEHDGFKGGEVRTERKAYELSLVLARWFQQRPEMMKLSPEFDDAGIRYFEKSLAELPAE